MSLIHKKRSGGSKETGGERLPDLRKTDHGKVIAILTSDWHLSLKAPVARSAEPDWLKAQARPFKQLFDIWEKHDRPVITNSGDIFDKWNPQPELINWALDHLPSMVAVVGNHDLPNHSYDDIRKSAYWTLERTDRITNIKHGYWVNFNGLAIWGFPYGAKLTRLDDPNPDYRHLALVHAYCWGPKGSGYKDAPKSAKAGRIAKQLKGFDVVSCGDNHIPFYWYPDESDIGTIPVLCNNGGLQRRTIAEIDHKPRVNLLHEDGHIEPHFLDCSEDKFIDVDAACEIAERAMDMSDFLDELKRLGEQGLDFVSAVKRFVTDNGIDRRVAGKIFESLETGAK